MGAVQGDRRLGGKCGGHKFALSSSLITRSFDETACSVFTGSFLTLNVNPEFIVLFFREPF